MLQVIAAVLAALVALILYRVVSASLVDRRAAAKAQRLGCKEPPHQVHRLPFGIDVIRRGYLASKEQRALDFVRARFEAVDAWTFGDRLLGSRIYMTSDAKNIQTVLSTNFTDYALGPRRMKAFGAMLGQGIFTEDGKAWEHSRAMMRPQFAREQVSDLQLEEEHLQALMQALPVGADGWTEKTDLQVLFFRLTLDSATEFLFGQSVHSQQAGLAADRGLAPTGTSAHDEVVFARAFDVCQRWLAHRVRFQSFYWLVTSDEFRTTCRQVHEFVDQFVRLALSKRSKEKEAEKGQAGGRERYVFLDALAAETQDPIQLRSQLLHILLAGRDTTASHLGWLFYTLARHPAVFDQLRQTIIETFGTYDDPRDITFARLKSCQYLQFCNNETLRLYPVLPVNGREAIRDTVLPTGGGPDGKSPIFVPKGVSVAYSVYMMHRRKDLWGEDADEFKPERWNGIKPGWNYLPFNGGPRICLGQQFALTEASYVIVRLLQRFDQMENLEPDPIVKHNLTLIDCSGNGVKVRLHEAGGAGH